VLNLLAALDEPVLLAVEDAHWLDRRAGTCWRSSPGGWSRTRSRSS
jgi:hypothetical protein